MKVLVIPDVHLKPNMFHRAAELMRQGTADRAVCLMDIPDDWNKQYNIALYPEWNYSAPHGAGRLMSRTKAKENLSMDEYRETMKGIYTTSINENTLDEAPMDCLLSNTTKVCNIKKYILAALFNAPTTMGGYFRAEVNHDMPQLAKAR